MDLIKKHVDTVVVLAGIVGSVMWMTGSIASLKTEMNEKFSGIDLKIAAIESDIRNINTILICKGVMPRELARDIQD